MKVANLILPSVSNKISKRDYFAAMAMQSFSSEMAEGLTFEEVAERCVLQANALIIALNNKSL